jgi:hypothetical protein
VKGRILAIVFYIGCAAIATAQTLPSKTDAEAIQQLQAEVAALREEVEGMRRQLESIRNTPNVSSLTEEQQLLSAKVDDQYQTKVESGSKYRVRLSGLALINAFSVRNTVDNLDVPTVALPRPPGESGGSFAASVRQSRINLQVFGPDWKGTKTTGEMSFDFWGGFPATNNGLSSALLRLRTATFALDGNKTSVVIGQDLPFFSPRSPTSLASSAHPSLSSSGNIWTWTPQVHVEHRFDLSETDTFSIRGGVLDAFTGESATEYDRTPTAGERSRVPAYATRVGWQRTLNDRAAAAGVGAYYSRQNWGFGRNVDSWALTTDWEFPFAKWFSLSGEFYRGRAMAGLGASASGSVRFSGPPPLPGSSVLPLENVGGWSQLKYKPLDRIEFNAAFGADQPFHHGINFNHVAVEGSPFSRNESGFFNVIYQARSNLFFSMEYRKLWTYGFFDPKRTADHISITSGIAF